MYEVNINGIKSRQKQKKKEQEESHVGNVDERRESREVYGNLGKGELCAVHALSDVHGTLSLLNRF